MTDDLELLTVPEAAVVSRVSLRDMNRVIDEHILPEEFFRPKLGRVVLAAGCPLISFYFASAARLTAAARLMAIAHVGAKLKRSSLRSSRLLKGDWTVRDDFLRIDIEPFLIAARERFGRLEAARAAVTRSPEVLSGTPVIKGTRVPAYDVAASLAAPVPIERVRAAYPGLTDDQLELSRLYAEAYPPRGRPRRETAVPEGAVVLPDRRIPRRKAG